MKLSRSSRYVTVLFALASLLFAQLAIAWYACPGDEIGNLTTSIAMSDESGQIMRGCEGMDLDQPGLCHAHGQLGNQSFDKPDFPHVQPFIAAGLTVVLNDVETASKPVPVLSDALLLTRTTAPPIAVRNCCFRI